MKKIISFAIALTMMSGCATMDDGQKTQAQGLGIGAIAGAGIGALVSKATGGHATDGAIIGGVLGGMAGGLYGNHVARKKAAYASTEDYLDVCVADAAKVRGEAEAFNVALQQDLDKMDARTTELLAAAQSGQSRKAELNALRNQGKTTLADAEKRMKSINAELELQRQVLAEERKTNPGAAKLAALQEQVDALEKQRSQLQQRTQRLASINNRMSV